MNKNTQIKYDLDNTLFVGKGDFEAEGFSSGFVLFQALRKAFLDTEEMKLNMFNEFIESIYDQIIILPTNIKEDFDKTWQLFKNNFYKSRLIYEWDDSANTGYTWWSNCIELVDNGNSKMLIYSTYNGDYGIDGSGWDCSDDFKNILKNNYLELSAYLSQYSEVDFHNMIETSVYNETGNCVFIVENNICDINNVKLLDFLLSDVNDNILNEEDYVLALESLKKALEN